jgi:hypothetical protein
MLYGKSIPRKLSRIIETVMRNRRNIYAAA